MAARSTPFDRRHTLLVRAGGLLTALLAAVGLVLLPPAAGGGRAHADTGSAVTKSGTKGQYDDFSGLKVTVEQTKNLRTQGLKVTWTGGAKTASNGGVFQADYLQIMQCWGDAATGPTPEQCEFGNPPPNSGVQNGTRAVGGRDPLETADRTVPFTTVKGQTSTDINQFFTTAATNEQDATTTDDNGNGETIFQAEDKDASPILGCGAVAAAGRAPQPCWLVVVPRGSHEPDGTEASTIGLFSSALSAGNWKQRIVFRLDFQPSDSPCEIGQDEHSTTGSDLMYEAMSSWEPKLCTTQKTTYEYAPLIESGARSQIARSSDGSAGLAFIEDPVQPQEGVAPVVHAPVAVSGLVIGYSVQVEGSSQQVPRIRLNARLVAKMLTESYQCDVPGDLSHLPHGMLSAKNARNLEWDPEFVELNPGVPYYRSAGCSFGLGVPQPASDQIAQLWKWLQSDPDAKAFLSGKPDPWGMVINPYFLQLAPATTALSDIGKPDPTAWTPESKYPDLRISAVGMNPYVLYLKDDATAVRKANNGGVVSVDTTQQPPAVMKASTQRTGQNFIMGLTDSASAARYRLGTAELLNADGRFVAPTVDSMTRAVNGMKPGEVPGVLDADPGLKTPGAYPLTNVTYAAASTSLSAADRKTYATLIRYAVGDGQQPGIGFGLLPPGYAPLTSSQRTQALDAASALVAGRLPTPPPGDTSSGGGTNSGGTGSSGGGTGASGGTGGGNGAVTGGPGTGGGSPSGSPSPSQAAAAGTTKGGTGGPSASPPVGTVARTGGTTPRALLGAVRWVLLIVLIAGIAGSLAGPVMMRAGIVRGTGRGLLPFRIPFTRSGT
ncbi:hypothetical protein [Actinacidiphila alni]|uniref:hypothetical protein n=1 Tax=Actinacidiphila alni TaxID=380248 RepID=UPI00345723CB